MRNLLSMAMTAMLLAACGDRAADGEDLASYCNERCAWQDRCGKTRSGCSLECQTEAAGFYTNYRAEFFDGMTECFRTLACTGKDDTCVAAGTQRVEPAILDNAAFQRCQSVRSGCKAADKPTFSDDYCASVVVLVSSAQDRVDACYQLACEQMKDCLKPILGLREDSDSPPPP